MKTTYKPYSSLARPFSFKTVIILILLFVAAFYIDNHSATLEKNTKVETTSVITNDSTFLAEK